METLPIKNLKYGPCPPDLEIILFPLAVTKLGMGVAPAGNYGVSFVRSFLVVSADLAICSQFFPSFGCANIHANPFQGPVILKPASRGYITLRSADPYDYPIIDLRCPFLPLRSGVCSCCHIHPSLTDRYLSDESDVNLCGRAMRLAMNLARTAPLVDQLDLRPAPGPDDDIFWPGDVDPDTIADDELKRIARVRSFSCLHPVRRYLLLPFISPWLTYDGPGQTSTARMGTDPSDSVVDLELRVHGVRGLRVCDASVFPDTVSGHPAIPVIAVAERAADIIKGLT